MNVPAMTMTTLVIILVTETGRDGCRHCNNYEFKCVASFAIILLGGKNYLGTKERQENKVQKKMMHKEKDLEAKHRV